MVYRVNCYVKGHEGGSRCKDCLILSSEIATCPMCGSQFDNRDAEKEPVYECVDCGGEGFDCCVPGNHSRCINCEKER